MLTMKEMLVSLLDSMEQLVFENIKLRIIIQSMPVTESPDFSLDDLIQETQLVGNTEKEIRKVYADARESIRRQSDPELALKKLLEQFPKHGGLH